MPIANATDELESRKNGTSCSRTEKSRQRCATLTVPCIHSDFCTALQEVSGDIGHVYTRSVLDFWQPPGLARERHAV